ncbi:MAG TPA: glycosyltransferase family 4 protein [Pseudonocardiaceae bacterium]|nr:glycosyltransferase family 4 protein [Pseudonocardiaceae bacterium]
MTAAEETDRAGRSVYVVMPGDVDDVTVPSGGNTYDRQVCQGLAAIGWFVRQVLVTGSWPRPDRAARATLDRSLAALPDDALVLVDGLVACGVPDVLVPHADRLRLLVLVHMPLVDDPALPAAVATELDSRERETLLAARGVVTTSPWSAGRLIDHHGLEPDQVHVVRPGTEPAPIAPGTNGMSRLLCVAAVTPGKGQDLLIEALSAVSDQFWCCLLVGSVRRDPAFVDRLRHTIQQRGLSHRVQLVGPSTGDRLAALYAAADLLVLATRSETYGMVATEALARGIPVLATAAGALPETLGATPDGTVPGLLVPPDDASAFAAALRRWFAEPDLRQRLRRAALQQRGGLTGWADTARTLAGVLAQLRQPSQEPV